MYAAMCCCRTPPLFSKQPSQVFFAQRWRRAWNATLLSTDKYTVFVIWKLKTRVAYEFVCHVEPPPPPGHTLPHSDDNYLILCGSVLVSFINIEGWTTLWIEWLFCSAYSLIGVFLNYWIFSMNTVSYESDGVVPLDREMGLVPVA